MVDTELCLSPGGRRSVLQTSHHGSSPSSRRVEERAAKTTHEQQQQMTIFYGSRVCVCDVTELQARAIISMAKQEMAANYDTTKKNLDVHVMSHPASLSSSTLLAELISCKVLF